MLVRRRRQDGEQCLICRVLLSTVLYTTVSIFPAAHLRSPVCRSVQQRPLKVRSRGARASPSRTLAAPELSQFAPPQIIGRHTLPPCAPSEEGIVTRGRVGTRDAEGPLRAPCSMHAMAPLPSPPSPFCCTSCIDKVVALFVLYITPTKASQLRAASVHRSQRTAAIAERAQALSPPPCKKAPKKESFYSNSVVIFSP